MPVVVLVSTMGSSARKLRLPLLRRLGGAHFAEPLACELRPRCRAVQITGCSSGLGRALALCLHAEGAGGGGARPYRVFASARNQASLKGLEAAGLETVQLDVTDQAGSTGRPCLAALRGHN